MRNTAKKTSTLDEQVAVVASGGRTVWKNGARVKLTRGDCVYLLDVAEKRGLVAFVPGARPENGPRG